MSTSAEDGAEIEDELGATSPERVGWFRFYFDERRWEWSDEVQRMHGYEPGTATPDLDMVLAHKHPDDRDAVAATIEKITHNRGAFSGRHRIIDTKDEIHSVVVIGDQFVDDNGTVIGTHGFYVDVTPAGQAREDIVTSRIGEIAENRAPIEQAKGMLMLVYDVDDDVAFGVLKWLSQRNNIKVRLLAERLCADLQAVAGSAPFDKTRFDHALLTAHQHITVDD